MRLPKFEYFEPSTLEEACRLLLQEETELIAGGTALLVAIKQRVVKPRALVNIKSIPNLDYVRYDKQGGLRIGALTTLNNIQTCSIIRERFTTLARAAGSIDIPQVLSIATLGGNVCLDSRCFYYNQPYSWRQSWPACYKYGGNTCHVVKGGDRCYASFMADTVPSLIAMDAEVKIASPNGEKQIALEKFYTGKGEKVNLLQRGEVLTEIIVPNQPPRTGEAYLKYSLARAADFAVAAVAVKITREPKSRVCTDARIVFGSVASSPIRAVECERVIIGRKISDMLVENVCRLATEATRPITHMGIVAGYKRKVIKALTKCAVTKAWQQQEIA